LPSGVLFCPSGLLGEVSVVAIFWLLIMSTWKVASGSRRPPPEPLVVEVSDAHFLARNIQRLLKLVASEKQLRSPMMLGFPAKKGQFWWAKILVPKDQALSWLKLSGADGVFFRPFFGASTLEKQNFVIEWLKPLSPERNLAGKVWAKLAPMDDFFGLVLGTKNFGVRLRPSAIDPFRNAISGLPVRAKPIQQTESRLWQLDKLSDAEMFDIDEIISHLELKVVGGVKKYHHGRFWKATFRAHGTPSTVPIVGSKFVLREVINEKKHHEQPGTGDNVNMVVELETQPPATETPPSPALQDVVALKEEIKLLKDEISILRAAAEETRVFRMEMDTLKRVVTEENDALKREIETLKSGLNELAQLRSDNVNLKSAVAEFRSFVSQTDVARLQDLCDQSAQQTRALREWVEPQFVMLPRRVSEMLLKELDSAIQRGFIQKGPQYDTIVAEADAAERAEEQQKRESLRKKPNGRGRGRGDPPPPPPQEPYNPHRDYSREYFSDPATLSEFFPTSSGAGRRGRGRL